MPSIPSVSAEQAALYGALINRRIAIRHPSAPAARAVLTRNTRSPFQKARIHDVSHGGIALVLRDAPAVGTTVYLQMTNRLLGFTFDLSAEVRHVSAHQRGTWLVGIEFDHALSPGELAALI